METGAVVGQRVAFLSCCTDREDFFNDNEGGVASEKRYV
jgi:hypothetical protein